MDPLDKLRRLIWDQQKNVFTDEELKEFLSDCNNDIYRTAAFCLSIVMANPERYTSYSLGGLRFTFGDLEKAIKKYEQMGAGSVQTTSLKREY